MRWDGLAWPMFHAASRLGPGDAATNNSAYRSSGSRSFEPAQQSKLTLSSRRPRCPGLHCGHRVAAADPGPLIQRALLEIRAVKSSILERNCLRIGDVFAL